MEYITHVRQTTRCKIEPNQIQTLHSKAAEMDLLFSVKQPILAANVKASKLTCIRTSCEFLSTQLPLALSLSVCFWLSFWHKEYDVLWECVCRSGLLVKEQRNEEREREAEGMCVLIAGGRCIPFHTSFILVEFHNPNHLTFLFID